MRYGLLAASSATPRSTFLDLAYLRRADVAAAEDELRALLARYPDNPYVLHELLVLHGRKGELAEGLRVGERLEVLLSRDVREGRARDDAHSTALGHLKKRTAERLAQLRKKAARPMVAAPQAPNPDDARRQLYVAHEASVKRLVGAHVADLSLSSRLGQFGFDELVDAGKDGLWEATAFWSDAINDHFMTYAWFYVMGRVKERRAQLLHSVSSSDLRFAEGSEHDTGGRRPGLAKDDETLQALQTLSFVEDQLGAVVATRKRALALATLDARGLLTEPEKRIALAIRDREVDVSGLDGELGLSMTELKIAATTLLRKLRSYLRDDDLFDATTLPTEYVPHLRPLALARVRSALHHVRNGSHLTCRPLATWPRFLADLHRLSVALGHGPQAEGQTAAGNVISIFKFASRLTMNELGLQTGLSPESLYQLSRGGRLTARHSPAKMASLANALSIDPTEVLFRALPEVMSAFERVARVAEGVYVGVALVDHSPETLATYLRAPDVPGQAHAFAPLARAYRLAAGASSADEFDARYAEVEAGRSVPLDRLTEVAAKVGMDPLLLLLGTWPELLALFDVVDETGRTVSEGRCDYARLVVVSRRRQRARTTATPPETPGLGGYLRFLVSGKPHLLVPDALATHGLSQRLIAGALGGTPPQLVHLGGIARALDLTVLETTRLIAEVVLASGKSPRGADLADVIGLLVRAMRARADVLAHGDAFLIEMSGLDDAAPLRLNAAFLDHVATRRRSEALASGIALFVDGALAILKGDSVGEFATLKGLYTNDEALEALYDLWRRDALTAIEVALLQTIVLRPKNLYVLVRELGVGFHGTVAAIRSLLAKVSPAAATPRAARAPRC